MHNTTTYCLNCVNYVTDMNTNDLFWLRIFEKDLDGSNKGKNQVCHDIFRFYYNNTGVIPDGQGAADNTSVNEHNCTAWIIRYDNMDYLKCSDLKFFGKTTCK